jgi:hypothetical protein
MPALAEAEMPVLDVPVNDAKKLSEADAARSRAAIEEGAPAAERGGLRSSSEDQGAVKGNGVRVDGEVSTEEPEQEESVLVKAESEGGQVTHQKRKRTRLPVSFEPSLKDLVTLEKLGPQGVAEQATEDGAQLAAHRGTVVGGGREPGLNDATGVEVEGRATDSEEVHMDDAVQGRAVADEGAEGAVGMTAAGTPSGEVSASKAIVEVSKAVEEGPVEALPPQSDTRAAPQAGENKAPVVSVTGSLENGEQELSAETLERIAEETGRTEAGDARRPGPSLVVPNPEVASDREGKGAQDRGAEAGRLQNGKTGGLAQREGSIDLRSDHEEEPREGQRAPKPKDAAEQTPAGELARDPLSSGLAAPGAAPQPSDQLAEQSTMPLGPEQGALCAVHEEERTVETGDTGGARSAQGWGPTWLGVLLEKGWEEDACPRHQSRKRVFCVDCAHLPEFKRPVCSDCFDEEGHEEHLIAEVRTAIPGRGIARAYLQSAQEIQPVCFSPRSSVRCSLALPSTGGSVLSCAGLVDRAADCPLEILWPCAVLS